jgi:hypothetical protein
MRKNAGRACPECGESVPAEPIDRRRFLRVAGGGAAAVALAGKAWGQDKPAEKPDRSAEEMIKELYAGLSEDQRKAVVHPFDDAGRLKIYNKAVGATIGKAYTKPQQELVQRILRSIAADEEGFRLLSRGGTWDASGSFDNCGADLYGDASKGRFTWVFSGHHLTIRCDGNSVEGPVFGGPLYYGHSPNGYATNNLFQFQTKSALAVYDAMNEAQRKQAVITGTPGEGADSIRLRGAGEAKPGIALSELDKEQQGLVEKVLKDLLAPYRKADADEALEVVKGHGGLEKIHFAFYREPDREESKRQWHFWRLEGPGFVWNFRVLPHVHTFVNISSKV